MLPRKHCRAITNKIRFRKWSACLKRGVLNLGRTRFLFPPVHGAPGGDTLAAISLSIGRGVCRVKSRGGSPCRSLKLNGRRTALNPAPAPHAELHHKTGCSVCRLQPSPPVFRELPVQTRIHASCRWERTEQHLPVYDRRKVCSNGVIDPEPVHLQATQEPFKSANTTAQVLSFWEQQVSGGDGPWCRRC